MPSIVNVRTAPANRSPGVFSPSMTGMAAISRAVAEYRPSASIVSRIASASSACAVCPSCHRNSVVRRNIRGRISQRTTLAHWFSSMGRSRCELIHLDIISPMIVSEVGRTTSGSSSSLPPAWVTTASSGANPSNVVRLAFQVALRYQQRKVRVLVPGRLDPAVQVGLQQLPQPVAVGADDHRALDRAAVHKLRFEDQFVVPGGEVFALRRHSAFVSCHIHEVRPVTCDAMTEAERMSRMR